MLKDATHYHVRRLSVIHVLLSSVDPGVPALRHWATPHAAIAFVYFTSNQGSELARLKNVDFAAYSGVPFRNMSRSRPTHSYPEGAHFGACRISKLHPAVAKLPRPERVASAADINAWKSIANCKSDPSRVKGAVLECVAPFAFFLAFYSHSAYRLQLVVGSCHLQSEQSRATILLRCLGAFRLRQTSSFHQAQQGCVRQPRPRCLVLSHVGLVGCLGVHGSLSANF
jgi:hypothetical protein